MGDITPKGVSVSVTARGKATATGKAGL